MEHCTHFVRSGEPSTSVDDLYRSAPGVPQDWARMLKRHEPGDGIRIGCMEGKAGAQWVGRAESPPMFCMAVMLDGRLRTALDGGASLDCQPGMVSIMSSGAAAAGWNCFSGDAGFRMVDIRLTPEALSQLTGQAVIPLRGKLLQDCSLPGLSAFMGCTPASTSLMQVANEVLACRLENPVARNLFMRGKAMEALAIVLENLMQQDEASKSLAVPSDRTRLLEARALMERSCEKDWSIQALSRTVGLNEKRLQAGFQSLFGMSVHSQLTRIRMDRAATMLSHGALVTDTALAVGFSSLSHFSKVFKEVKGSSPKQWALGG